MVCALQLRMLCNLIQCLVACAGSYSSVPYFNQSHALRPRAGLDSFDCVWGAFIIALFIKFVCYSLYQMRCRHGILDPRQLLSDRVNLGPDSAQLLISGDAAVHSLTPIY